MNSVAALTALDMGEGLKYKEWFRGTIARNFKAAQGRPIEDYSHFLDDPTTWIRGNSFNVFSTSTCLSTQNDLKSPVYAAPYVQQNTLAVPLVSASSEHFVGLAKAVLVNSQNGALLASRFVNGTSVDAVLERL